MLIRPAARASRRRSDRVADTALAHLLHPGDEVAHLADAEVVGLDRLGADDADLEHLAPPVDIILICRDG